MQHTKARNTRTRTNPSGKLPAAAGDRPIVNIWYAGHSVGLYRVNKVEERAMVINHGAISFPVGTPLDVVDFQNLIPNAGAPRLSARVVDNNRSGIQLAW